MTDPIPAPDYSGIIERALDAKSFGQLTAATYATVNAIYENPQSPAAVIAWVSANAGSRESIDATLKKFLCFLVVDPDLLPFNGVLADASLELLQKVLATRVSNYVAAIARAGVTP